MKKKVHPEADKNLVEFLGFFAILVKIKEILLERDVMPTKNVEFEGRKRKNDRNEENQRGKNEECGNKGKKGKTRKEIGMNQGK